MHEAPANEAVVLPSTKAISANAFDLGVGGKRVGFDAGEEGF